jgi:hypothetical protein
VEQDGSNGVTRNLIDKVSPDGNLTSESVSCLMILQSFRTHGKGLLKEEHGSNSKGLHCGCHSGGSQAGKMIHSPEKAARTLGCIDPICADAEVGLNVIHSEDSLMLSLSSLYTPDIIPTLVDSGSSHCFIDSAFVLGHDLLVADVAPKKLHLFDGTCGTTCRDSP